MTEELENKATSVLLSLIDKLEEGGELLAGEIPELLEQLLKWKMAVACLNSLFLAVLWVGLVWFVSWLLKQGDKEENQNEPGYYIVAVFTGFMALVVAGLLTGQLGVVLHIWLAPKVYLLEYAAGLVNK